MPFAVSPATQLISSPGTIMDEASAAADKYSKVVLRKKNVQIISFHVVVTYGSFAGTYAIQESNDGTNWVTVTMDDGSTTQAISGANVNAMHHILTSAKYLGVVLTRSSGTATRVLVNVSMASGI